MAESDTEEPSSTKEETSFVKLDSALSSVEWTDGFPIEVHLVGEITSISASEFESSFRDATKSGQEEIVVVIHSVGGCVYSAAKIVDLIKYSSVPVHTCVRGYAMSAAVMIFSCGVHRVIGNHASLMIHSASSGWFDGKSLDLKVEAYEVERLTNLMCDVMSENTGQTFEYFKDRMDKNTDLYISPTEALANNLATHIGDIRLETNIVVKTSTKLVEYTPKKKQRIGRKRRKVSP